VRSLVLHPATTTHAGRTAAERAELGIGDGLVRLSVGIEDVSDLLADVERGLAAVRAATGRDGAGREARPAPATEVAALARAVPQGHLVAQEV
jgi:O-acetylhomoserine (thiol)-lyase